MIRRGIRAVCICFKKELRMQGDLHGLVLTIYGPVQFPLILQNNAHRFLHGPSLFLSILFFFTKQINPIINSHKVHDADTAFPQRTVRTTFDRVCSRLASIQVIKQCSRQNMIGHTPFCLLNRRSVAFNELHCERQLEVDEGRHKVCQTRVPLPSKLEAITED